MYIYIHIHIHKYSVHLTNIVYIYIHIYIYIYNSNIIHSNELPIGTFQRQTFLETCNSARTAISSVCINSFSIFFFTRKLRLTFDSAASTGNQENLST